MNEKLIAGSGHEKGEDRIYPGQHLWKDPLSDDPPGILLSDRIAYYARRCKMIVPFEEKSLRPASYTLHVGDTYYYGCATYKEYGNLKAHKLGELELLRVPPNGLVYIKVKEYFNIPYYIVGCYSLRVKQVYRGLIVDNGLQLDPGYHGHISVPVYNFTNEEKFLRLGDPFLSMEFIKTSPFQPAAPIEGESERDWVATPLSGMTGEPIKIFEANPDKLYHEREITAYFESGEKNESSVEQMGYSVKELGDTVGKYTRRFEKAKLIAGLALLTAFLAVFGYIYHTVCYISNIRVDAQETRDKSEFQAVELHRYDKESSELRVNIDRVKEDNQEIQGRLVYQEKSRRDIIARLESLEKQIKQPSQGSQDN